MNRIIRRLPGGSLLMLILFAGILLSGLAISYTTHISRLLLNELFSEMTIRDHAQAEWGRLILEQSTWTAHGRVEQLATGKLGMRVPDTADVRMVTP